MFDHLNHPVLCVQVNQIDWEQQTDRMNASGWHHPQTFVGSQPQSAQQSFQTRPMIVCSGYTKGKKRFARLIEDTICLGLIKTVFHSKAITFQNPALAARIIYQVSTRQGSKNHLPVFFFQQAPR